MRTYKTNNSKSFNFMIKKHTLISHNNAYARKIKFVNFYKLYYMLIYYPEIGTALSVVEYDAYLAGFNFLLL